jgi:hypothetical protein
MWAVLAACLVLWVAHAPLRAESPVAAFPREEIHVANVGADEAVTNLRIANNRWVDCFDNATAIRDIFRIAPYKRTGWPRAVSRPGLPQTRTCAINAFGSSSYPFATRRHTEWIAQAYGRG